MTETGGVDRLGIGDDLTERELAFVRRIVAKYERSDGAILGRSLAVFTAGMLLVHAIERSALDGWAAFLVVYVPAVGLYVAYRRLAIFRTRILRKLALRAGLCCPADEASPDA